MHDDVKKYWLALRKISGVGANHVMRICDYFGSPRGIWEASTAEVLAIPGIDRATRENILSAKRTIDIDEEWKHFAKSDVILLTIFDELYPMRLKQIPAPPPVLFVRGNAIIDKDLTVAIVGSRRCTAYGRHVAEQLGEQLAGMGVIIVSGMARGIDSQAHRGAIRKGRTFAVLGSGIDVIYPPENHKLYTEIMAKGAVISEYPPSTPPHPGHFPARNRIISGLSHAVIVVEAAEKSGALITVDFALEQGRDVYAVPGCITNSASRGCHKLIQQGAKLLDSVEDIIEDLGIMKQSNPAIVQQQITELTLEEQTLVGILDAVPLSIDQVVEKSNWSVSMVASVLMSLELKGVVESQPGKRYKITDVNMRR